MNESKLGYLVKIVKTDNMLREANGEDRLNISLVNKIGVITYIYKFLFYNMYNIFIEKDRTVMLYKNEIEILNTEPAYNINIRCFWCNEQNNYISFKKKRFYYCPKCLR